MARPLKSGLDYFPLDVHFDDSIELLEAECGLEGIAILIKLWQKIYSNGYYTEWDYDNALLFAKKINTDINKVNSVVNVCLRRNIFDLQMYEKYKILTSRGIQKRYITACVSSKRKTIVFLEKYLLVDNGHKAQITEIITEEMELITEETQLTQEESTQRKGKERKGKERKGEGDISPDPQQADVKKIMDFYKENFGARAVPAQIHMLLSFLDDGAEADLIIEALTIAVKGQKFDLRYVEKILINWSNKGIKTLQQYKDHEAQRELSKKAGQINQPADKPKQVKISDDDIDAAVMYIDMELTEFKENNPTDAEIQEFLYRKQFDYHPEIKRRAFERLNLMQYWKGDTNG